MISNIIPSHDADTLNLDFGVFIAKRAKRYRTSQAAIVAALRPSFTPSQPETHAPAADTSTIAPVDEATDGEEGISLPTPPSVEPIQPRVQGRQQEVARLHAEHPDWPAKMIGAEMGISGSNVSQHATRLGITLPTIRNYTATKAAKTTAALKAQAMAEQPPVNAPAKPPTLADQIKAHLVDHPDATLRDVTDAIGGTLQSVGWAAQKAGIILRKYTPEERSEATAKGIAARKAGVAPSLPNRPIREVITHPTRGAGPSTRFYVRDKAGRYVHQGLRPITNRSRPAHDGQSQMGMVRQCPAVCRRLQEVARIIHHATGGTTAMNRTIYLSGPMTGLPQYNYPAFHDAAAKLRAAGHRVYNPAEYPHHGTPETFPIRAAFADYSRFICLEADTIVLMPGWEKSKGVSAEKALAENCGIDVLLIAEVLA